MPPKQNMNLRFPLQRGTRPAVLLITLGLMLPFGASAQSNRDLVLQFRDGFERGCNQGSTPDVTNQRGYCNCMANSFQARYSGKELSTISQYASTLGQQGTALISLMMSPEARACTAKY